MTVLDYIAIGMLALMACLGIGVIVLIGGWPARVAAKRRHPYRTAVSIGGWVSLIAGGVLFPLVLIWAYAGSTDADVTASDAAEGGAA